MKRMKKTNTSSLKRMFPILAVIVLSIALLVVIHHIFTSKQSKKEKFNNLEIVVPNNFYDLTQDSSVFSSPTSDTNKINHTLSAPRLCIYNDSAMECISAGELAIALDLPQYRKEQVCIDEECLGYEDLQILNGDPENKFKISHHYSDRGPNAEHKNCLALKNIRVNTCDGTPITNGIDTGIKTLGLDGCSEAHHFTFHDTEFGAADIREEVDGATLVSDLLNYTERKPIH